MKYLKALLVEDSEDDALMLLRHLKLNDYEVEYRRVETADEMEKALVSENWQIILSDYNLPRFDGLSALATLKQSGYDIPFIIISGTMGEDKAVLAMLAGVDDYFVKDSLTRLIPAIERELQEAENRRARRRAEEALDENKKRLQLALEATGMGVWEWNLQSNEVYGSPECYQIAGIDIFKGKIEDFQKYVHPEDIALVMNIIHQAIENHQNYAVEFRIINPKGEIQWLANHAMAEYDADGKPLRIIGTVQDITERKQAEGALRDSEENFRALIQASTQFVWTADERGGSEELFQWFSELSGRPVKSVQDIMDIEHPEDLEEARIIWRKALQNKTLFNFVSRFLTKDNKYHYLAARSVPIFNRDGSFRQWIGTFNDITERMETEESLRESEELNRAVLNSMLSNIAVLDGEGTIIAVNEAWRNFALQNHITSEGFPQSTDVGANYLEICSDTSGAFAEETEEVCQSIKQVLDGESKSFSLEYSNHSPENQRWFFMNVTPLKTKAGGAVVSHTEITDLKLAEEALRKNEAQLQLVSDTVPTIIAYIDADLYCRFANEACLKWFGNKKERALGKHAREIFEAEVYQKILPEFEKVLSGEALTFERASYRDNGSRYLRFNYMPDFDREGNVQGFFAFIIDLTENKRAEEKLLKSEEQLLQAQKLESVGRLAGGIAHDFNNMLTAINGYSDLTLRRLDDDSPLRRNIEEIKKAGERSAALTQQLLAFSRRAILQVKTLDINQIISDSIVMLQRLIGEDVQIVSVLNPRIDFVEADPGQLSQVLLNLAINARDAMPQGGTVTIETGNVYLDEEFISRHAGAQTGNYVRLAVSDTGIGMDDDIQQHIFEPFFTTKDIGKGTGLGLSTVYGIIKQSGGSITVRSAPGAGTTFEIYLPSVKGAGNSTENQPDPGAPLRGNETILLVEDEDIVRKLNRQILESCGYQVIEAESGMEALAYCEENPQKIDLLMTDVVMPKMSGRVLAEKLAQIQPEMKILFTSGYTDDAIVQHGVTEAEMNFIQKPFSFEEITRKVRDILDNHK